MAFGVSQKVSHDISSAFGKGLHGLKVEAMANQRKVKDQKKGKDEGSRRLSGRAILESIMLGIFTITVAAIPVIVTRVPAPESLIIVKEMLQDWCTPSICFVVLIVGVMIATSGVLSGSDDGSRPEQNHKFTESYLIQRPVSASQMDPLRMPDIFFSADAARANALSHSASFPVRVSAQPSSVMVPVYYPAFIPPQPSPFSLKSDDDPVEADRFLPRHEGRFESNGGDRFVPRVDDRFSPRVDDRFSPRVDDRFSPRVDDRFSPRVEERFVPRVEERFSPRVEERFVPRVEERFSPRVEERFPPRAEEMFVPQVKERYVPQVEERYVPQVEERYVPQVEERYVPQVEERYESQEQDRSEAEQEDGYEPEEEVRFDTHVESTGAHHGAHHDYDVRSESEDEAGYEPGEEVESEREDPDVESEADFEGEVEAETEMRSDSEDEVEHISQVDHDYDTDRQPPPVESVERKVLSPPDSPVVPAAVEVAPTLTHLPPSQRQSYSSNSSIVADTEASSNLLSRRRPPIVPAPVPLQKAPPPPPVVSEPVTTPNLTQKPQMSVRVERKDTSEIARPSVLSPRTPPKQALGKRPLSSSSSRTYAEFVRRTSKFSPRTPLEPPRPIATPKAPSPPTIPKPDAVAPVGLPPKAVETNLVKLKPGRNSTSPVSARGGSALMKQLSMPARRPREVRVVDDDSIDDTEQTEVPEEDDDVDQRVEAFLKNFREQMRLQRQESLQRHRRSHTGT